MMRIKNLSIQKKLIAIQLLTVFIVLLFFSISILSKDLHFFRESVIDQLMSMAKLIGANSVSAINFLDDDAAQTILASLDVEEEIVNAWIYTADGLLFAKYSRDGFADYAFPELEQESHEFKIDFTTLTMGIIQEGKNLGTISLRINMEHSRAHVRQRIMIAFLVMIMGMVIALILSHLTQRTISRPVLKLVGISKSVSRTGDYSVRVEKEANDEIGILFDTYNDMMAQIEKRALERKQAEENLIREKNFTDSVINSLPGMFYVFAEDGGFLRWNENVESLTQYSGTELRHMSPLELFEGQEKETVAQKIKDVFRQGKGNVEANIVSKNGEKTPYYLTGLRTEITDTQYLVGTAINITEQKRMERAIKKQLKFENLIVTISTNFIDLDTDEINTGINHALQSIGEFADVERSYILLFTENGTKMNYTHEWCREGIEPEMENFQDVPIDLFPYFAEKIRNHEVIYVPRISDLPEEAKVEKELIPKKGIQSLINVPMIYGGRMVGFLGMHSIRIEKTWSDDFIAQLKIVAEMFVNMIERERMEKELAKHKNHLEELVTTRTIELTNTNKKLQQEIIERKQAEEARRENEEKFQAISGSAQDAIIIMGNNGKITYWNDAGNKIFGYSNEEVIGQDLHQILAPERYHEAYLKGFKKFQKTGKGKVVGKAIELIGLKKDGTEFPFELSLSSVKIKNKWNAIGILRDITERKQAEEKLMLYRKIFINTNDGIIIMNPDGQLIERNPAHRYLSGYYDDEELGTTVARFMGEKTYNQFINELIKTKTYRGEFGAHRKDGTPINIDLSAFSIEHENGKLAYYVGMSRDITERKRAEQAIATRLRIEKGLASCSRTLLTEAETEDAIDEALHYMLEAAKTSRVYIFENFEDIHDGLCMRQTHEVCAEDVEPQIDDPLLQHAPYKMGFDRWRETLSKGESINGLLETFPQSEQEIFYPQGNLSMLVIPIKVEGEWYGFIGFDDVWEKREWSDEDIRALQTASEMIGIYIERKKYNEMLRVSEERFRSLVENADDVIYSMSPKGKLTYISPKFTDILGYEVSEFLGASFFPLIHPDDLKVSIDWFQNGLQNGSKQSGYQYRFLHQDGSIRWFSGNSSVIRDENHNVLEVIGVAHDFTQMKNVLEDLEDANRHLRETQSQLVQSAKMASLGQLVAGIAHEINTPIGAVNSMQDTLFRTVENIREIVNNEIPKKYVEQTKFDSNLSILQDAKRVIQSGTERVITIVRRLRSFARLDEAELKTVDIHDGLEDTLTLIHHEIKHSIAVKKKYGNIPPIACFPGKLNQVFLNILVNAKQAIEDRGEITITTYSKKNTVYIEIQDDGKGIAKDDLSKVFDPGFTTKGVGVGTGLGLSICYRIIQEHEGDLTVKSAPGKGTTFTIAIPMNLDETLFKKA